MKFDKGRKLYSISDVAVKLNLSVVAVWRNAYVYKRIPEPAIRVGRRDYFSEAAFKAITEENPDC